MPFQIVLRSNFDGRIVSLWRSGKGWYPDEPTKLTTPAEAEREPDALRQSQPENARRIFIETDRAIRLGETRGHSSISSKSPYSRSAKRRARSSAPGPAKIVTAQSPSSSMYSTRHSNYRRA
jgi:hypothetical protein